MNPIEVGIAPVNKLLYTDKYSSFDNDPIAGGRVPPILLSANLKNNKFVINPIVSGMVPVNAL